LIVVRGLEPALKVFFNFSKYHFSSPLISENEIIEKDP